MYNRSQKILVFSNVLIMFGGLQALGVLADVQVVIMGGPFNNLLSYCILLGIPLIFIHYRKYFFVGLYAILPISVGISVLYYDHIFLLERGFLTFGLIIPSILILGGAISVTILLSLLRFSYLSK